MEKYDMLKWTARMIGIYHSTCWILFCKALRNLFSLSVMTENLASKAYFLGLILDGAITLCI